MSCILSCLSSCFSSCCSSSKPVEQLPPQTPAAPRGATIRSDERAMPSIPSLPASKPSGDQIPGFSDPSYVQVEMGTQAAAPGSIAQEVKEEKKEEEGPAISISITQRQVYSHSTISAAPPSALLAVLEESAQAKAAALAAPLHENIQAGRSVFSSAESHVRFIAEQRKLQEKLEAAKTTASAGAGAGSAGSAASVDEFSLDG
ncbi:MAG: hypothetical protein HYX48_08410 [Chlamydiales bacterium]|nr:hypothetical protein [Chlamydiales bacterium]